MNCPTKNQTSSTTGWLRMRVWRMSLRRTKSTIISWHGSYVSMLLIVETAERKISFYAPQLQRSWGGILVWACPSVRGSHFAYGQERLKIGSWNLICGISMKNKRTCVSFFSVELFVAELCPFLTFFWLSIVSLWNLVNKISRELDIWLTDFVPGVDDLINFWENSLNIWLNYLPFPTVIPCSKATLWTKSWPRNMISGIQFGYMM